MQFYRSSFPTDNIKRVVINFYISDEITAAKDVLWLFCGVHLGDKVSRRVTTAKSQQDTDVSDIMT